MSTPDTLFLYADEVSAAALRTDRPRVLLLGGYLGYPNFGDILQLKGAIHWHREFSGLEPVVLCDLAAATDKDFTARLRQWFGTEAILAMSDDAVDASKAGLTLFSDAAPAGHLHVYGGGFLNRLWGPRVLRFAELLHERFGVGHYVMSGQQAEDGLLPALQAHIERCRPILVGGRDRATVELLARTGAPSAYSFDDAAEQMQRLATDLTASPAAQRDPAATSRNGRQLLLHLNASTYADQSPRRLDALAARLTLLGQWCGRGALERADPNVTLLHAYNDARIADVSDTLGTVQRLDDRFPFWDYRVLHLGRLAYELGAGAPGALASPPILRSSGAALTCSYHAAMLCMMLDIPVWLETRNAYYRQKAQGLGLLRADPTGSEELPERTDAEFASFLEAPRSVSLDRQLAERRRWLDELRAAYDTMPARRTARPGPAVDPSRKARTWIPKGELVAGARTDGVAAANAGDARPEEDLHAWCARLEEAKAWLESQLTAYKALAEQRATSIEELKTWNATLQAANRTIDGHLREHKLRADTATGELVRATNELAQARQGTAWLEKQRGDWEATARRNEADIVKLKAWIHELEAAKAWLAGDRDRWKAAAEHVASPIPRPPG